MTHPFVGGRQDVWEHLAVVLVTFVFTKTAQEHLLVHDVPVTAVVKNKHWYTCTHTPREYDDTPSLSS